ncbi:MULTISPECIES: hypothetical protein [unclassified Paenibacillus]|uniref:hypothetical protein n=1 Tax=unclassified Paenibacillus TaxID=185978 RepID=UPI00020D7BAA|nr:MULTISPECIES: hypothetical protein [unclassified Paenibacillus]EGL18557.1 hypothetical protein HMPREF9413_5916 [Paenibacillus sp. HGF7]EPD80522.1 hypothetical protein HMPREF1207_05628 [Paenibacillus sp. HGH0039]
MKKTILSTLSAALIVTAIPYNALAASPNHEATSSTSKVEENTTESLGANTDIITKDGVSVTIAAGSEDSDILQENSSVRAEAEKFLANRHNAKTVTNPDSYSPKSDPIWGNETIVLSRKSNDYKNAVKKDVITFVSAAVTNTIGLIGGILTKNVYTTAAIGSFTTAVSGWVNNHVDWKYTYTTFYKTYSDYYGRDVYYYVEDIYADPYRTILKKTVISEPHVDLGSKVYLTTKDYYGN